MSTALKIYSEFESSLMEIKEACNFLPDVTTKEGYEKSKRIGLDGRKVEKAIDDKRLELRKEAMKKADEIHEAGKALCDEVASYYKPHQEAYKAKDAEVKRIKEEEEAKITAEIQQFSEAVIDSQQKTAEEIKAIIDNFNSHPLDFGARTIEAGQARDKAVSQLENMRAQIIIRDEESRRLEKQRIELEKQQEEARKAQAIIDEANRLEAEKIALERAKFEEEQRIELEKQKIKEAEERAAKAERDRILEQEKIERQEEEKRAANKAHRKSINNSALNAFVSSGFSEDDAKRAVELIAQGKIPNVTISY